MIVANFDRKSHDARENGRAMLIVKMLDSLEKNTRKDMNIVM